MKKLLLLSLGLLAPVLVFAQFSAFNFNQDGGGFYVNAGTLTSNIDKQYNALRLDNVSGNNAFQVDSLKRQPVAYPMPANRLLSFGIGGYGIRSSIVFGGEANVFLGTSKSATLKDTTLNPQNADYNYNLKSNVLGADAMATIGIVALRATGLVIRPMVGIGYGAMSILISDSRGGRQYPNYTKGNQENQYLYNSGVVFDIGIAADYHFSSSGERAKGFTVTGKFGYRSQSPGSWINRSDKISTTDFRNNTIQPSIAERGSQGLYFKIGIGVGSCGKTKV